MALNSLSFKNNWVTKWKLIRLRKVLTLSCSNCSVILVRSVYLDNNQCVIK